MALINARPEMDKELPRFNMDSSLDLILAVEQAEHVSDYGIAALSFVQRYGSCSLHGQVKDEVEVSNGVELAEPMIRCWACKEDFGVTKRCMVEAVGPVSREET